MSNLTTHAMAEFRSAGWMNEQDNFKDETQGLMCTQVLELLELFSSHGHSDSSAAYAIDLFFTLAKYEPITPLTGKDEEWNDIGDGLMQNIRCSRVFKNGGRFNGAAFDCSAVIFYDWCECDLAPDEPGYPGKERYKSCYTNSDSAVQIEFPYIPKTEYRETPSE